jgi:hypothetical protein
MTKILECEYCCEAVDPERDPYSICTDPWGGNAQVICENCREREYDRHQEHLMECGPGPTLREQQIAAMRFK